MLLPARLKRTVVVLPERTVLNSDLRIDDEKCFRHTGVHERRYALPHQATSDLISKALGLCPSHELNQLGTLVVGTTSPDVPSPATAHFVHKQVGLRSRVLCFDAMSSCSSYLSALTAGLPWLQNASDWVAVCAGEVKHKCLNPEDVRTRSLFGDGAAAQIWAPPSPHSGETPGGNGLHLAYVRTRSDLLDLLQIPGGGSRLPCPATQERYLTVRDGKYLFQEIVKEMTIGVRELVQKRRGLLNTLGLSPDTPGSLYMHQANANILAHVHERVRDIWPQDPPCLMSDVGNTVGASLPMAFGRYEMLKILAHRMYERGMTPEQIQSPRTILQNLIASQEHVPFRHGGVTGEVVTLNVPGSSDCYVTVCDLASPYGTFGWLNHYFSNKSVGFQALKNCFKNLSQGADGPHAGVSCHMLLAAGGGFQTIGILILQNHFHERK